MNRWKYVLVGLLVGAFAFPLVWNSDPLVIGQTVTVDSTQSPLVVNALADLANLTPTDGQSVIIKTGTEKGLWYYDKDSVAVVDSVAVLTGPGSVGRFLVINNDAGSIAAATAITAAQIDNDVDLEFGVFDADSPRSLTLAELKKTGVQVVNVKQYGATGDGVTDDTAAYLALLAAVDGTNNVAYFPPGTYLLSSLAAYGYQVSDTLKIVGDNATIKGDSVVGHYDAITLVDGAELDIEGVTFDTFYVSIWGQSTFLTGSMVIRDCKFTNCESCVATDPLSSPSLIVIEDCEFYEWTHYGILVRGIMDATVRVCRNVVRDSVESTTHTGINVGDNGIVTSKSVLVDSNHIYNVQCTAASTLIGMFVSGYSATITNNTLEDVYSASRGTTTDAGIYSKAVTGSIENNTLINAGRGNGCIVWKDGVNACSISDNLIVMSDSTQDWFTGIRAYIDNGVVTGNVLNGLSGNVQTGIEVGQTPTNVAVTNNTIVDCIYSAGSQYPITCAGGTNIRINDNRITRCGSSYAGGQIACYGINLAAATATENIEICGNRLDEAVRGMATSYDAGVSITGTATGNSNLVISGNTITGYCIGINFPYTAANFWTSVRISDNTIDSQGVGSAGGTSCGIYAWNLRNGEISSNLIKDLTGSASDVCAGIYLNSSIAVGNDNLSIRDNVILNVASSSASWGHGIIVDSTGATANDIDVSGNVVKVARQGIHVTGTSSDANLSMTHNMIFGITGVGAGNDYTFTGPATSQVQQNYEDYVLHTVNGTIEASTAGSGSPNVLLQLESKKLLTNEGTTAANYHTLPTAVAGLTYTFVVQDADGLRITGATGDTIRLGPNVTATAGYIESTTIGDYVTLTAINATEWVGHAYGTWTNGTWSYALADTP